MLIFKASKEANASEGQETGSEVVSEGERREG